MKDGSCGSVGCIAKVLLIVGGLNWGLVGAGMLAGKGWSWDLVAMLLGSWPTVQAIVYVLVGLSAVVSIVSCSKKCSTK
ncbi:MAG: DUF378 domain-containing protein [Candidatus Gracilibacteria bacterium]|nr:DUF378 domain-containing protein [Candidatus Gracilibacteria bacterium]